MRAIGYIRVSTDGQATDGVSLDAQRAKIAAWCGLNAYELVAVYSDAGMSGKRADNRPELGRALDHAKRQRGAALVVYSLSRLSRSVKDTMTIAEQLDRAGADLVSLSERIDTTSAAGKMVFRMLAVFAEFERDLVSERTRAALAHKKANGEAYSPTPFGFRREGERLVEEEHGREAVAVIRELRAAGLSFRAIAGELTARGIPTAKGGRWASETVRKIVARVAA